MINLLKIFVGLFGVFWLAIAGGYAVYWYDNRPINIPAPLTFHVLWLTKSIGLPPSLRAQRDMAESTYKQAIHSAEVKNQALAAAYDKINTLSSLAESKAQTIIRTRTVVLRQEIPDVITPQVDHDFRLPVGLIRVHDAAALGVDLSHIPYPSGITDEDTSSIKTSELGDIIASNYGECSATSERLVALQSWIHQVAGVSTR